MVAKKMFLLKNKDEIIKETEDYYKTKVEVDFFIEVRGEHTYLMHLMTLKKYNLPTSYSNIVALDQYFEKWYELCYTYISLFEDYLRHILYCGDYFINYNAPKEKYLPTLLEMIASSKEIYEYVFQDDIDNQKLLDFRRKIIEHHPLSDEQRSLYIVNFYKALPPILKKNFYDKYLDLVKKYKFLGYIISDSIDKINEIKINDR